MQAGMTVQIVHHQQHSYIAAEGSFAIKLVKDGKNNILTLLNVILLPLEISIFVFDVNNIICTLRFFSPLQKYPRCLQGHLMVVAQARTVLPVPYSISVDF